MALSPEEWLKQNESSEVISPEEWLAKTAPPQASLQSASSLPENIEYQFDPRVPAVSSIAGAALSSLPWFRVGSLAGAAIKGGLGAGVGATAGEAIRDYSNNSNLGRAAAIGAEMAGGAAPSILGEVVGRLRPAALGALFGYQKGKTVQSVTGVPESESAMKQALFGKQVMQEGVATVASRNAVRDQYKKQLEENYGIIIPEGAQKVSKFARNHLYKTLDDDLANGGALVDSPQFQEALSILESGVNRGISPTQFNAIKGLLESQKSPHPVFKGGFNERLINTIQKADPEFDGVKIPKNVADFLRATLDDYLVSSGKSMSLSQLKKIEQDEIVAKAVDSIPVLLSGKFKGKATEKAASNIAKAGDEGQQALKLALGSYFRDLPPEKVISKWNDVAEALTAKGAFSVSDFLSIQRAIVEVSKRKQSGAIAKDIADNISKNAIVRGLIPAEFAQMQVEEAQNAEALAPFSM